MIHGIDFRDNIIPNANLSEYGPIIGSHDSYLLPDFSGFKSFGIVVLSHNRSLLD